MFIEVLGKSIIPVKGKDYNIMDIVMLSISSFFGDRDVCLGKSLAAERFGGFVCNVYWKSYVLDPLYKVSESWVILDTLIN